MLHLSKYLASASLQKTVQSSRPIFLRCVTQLTIQTWLIIKSTQSRLILYL